jgi:hypothetical protein
MKIFKYSLTLGSNDIEIPGVFPTSFQPRFVSGQDEVPTLWLGVDESLVAYPTFHEIMVVGTGECYGPNWAYLGSCMCGAFVWHVFWRN